jgi:hypothetical protein
MARLLLSLVFLLAALPAPAQKPPDGKFFHHVFFWLNEPQNPAARQEFLDAVVKMKAIPTVKHFMVGRPAGTPRDVVDGTYTFDLLVTFEDRKGWQVYNDHPLHDDFRKKAGLWKKVQIYDSLLER